MGQARQVIVLADSSKAGKVSFASAGRWENVHVLITDKQLDKDFAKELVKKGHQARPSLRYKDNAYMKKSPTYLSDSRPKFTPFEIDCGKIPAYRYKGNLEVRTQGQDDHARRGGGDPGRHAGHPRAGGDDRQAPVRRLRADPRLQLPRPDARLGRPGRHRRRRLLRAAIGRQHHQHPPRPRRKPGQGHRRHPPDDRRATPPARAQLPVHQARGPGRGRAGRACLSHDLRTVRQGRRLLPRAAAARCTSPISPSAISAPTPLSAAACRLPPARPWPTATCSAATWSAALPATAPTPTAWCWNR